MPKEYIVGLDGGHGETAAWIVPITPSKDMEATGDSARLNASNNADERVRHSVIYQTTDGEYSLYDTAHSAIITKMKSRVSELRKDPKKMEAYRKYIRLTVEELVKLNPILTLSSPKDGKPNFHICMASPTKWNDRDKNEYLQFFNEAVADIGISFDWIINESDAAYFSFHSQVESTDVVLIIDFGSSTIDYTVMHNGKKISKDEWSNSQLGAGNIEDAMIDSYRTMDYDEFQQSYNSQKALLENSGNGNISVLDCLNYKCRGLKEYHYKNGTPDTMAIEYHLGDRVPELISQLRKSRFVYDFSLSDVIEGYRNAVRTDFEELKAKIEETTGKKVTKIVLSGGACIMGWVAPMVNEIFPGVKIIDDRNPSFVVAKGIALYALAQKKALEELLNDIAAVDYAKAYCEADSKATKDSIKDLSAPTISSIRSKTTCIQMVECFNDYIRSLNGDNYQYVSLVHTNVSKSLTQTMRSAIANAFFKHFNWKIETSGIGINVDVQCLPWQEEMFCYEVNGQDINFENTGAWSANVMYAIHKILDRHLTWFTGVNWTKDRGSDDRNYIANELVSEVLVSDIFDNITYPEGFVADQANAIKAQALKYAEDIFYSNQLFRTTFS